MAYLLIDLLRDIYLPSNKVGRTVRQDPRARPGRVTLVSQDLRFYSGEAGSGKK